MIIRRNIGVWPVLTGLLREAEIDLIVLGTRRTYRIEEKRYSVQRRKKSFAVQERPVLTIGPSVRRSVHNGGRFQCNPLCHRFQYRFERGSFLCDIPRTRKPVEAGSFACATGTEAREEQKLVELSVAEALHRMADLLPGCRTLVPAGNNGGTRRSQVTRSSLRPSVVGQI